jgi:hypothetical protein
MNIQFDWRVALHRSDRESLRNKILSSLRHWIEAGRLPGRVIVSPATFDPYDERIIIEVRGILGEVLTSGQLIEPSAFEIA